jgi:hypothetical protein
LDLQCLGQALDGCRIDGKRRRRRRQRIGPQANGVEGDDGDERQQYDRCDQPNPPGGLQKSTLS